MESAEEFTFEHHPAKKPMTPQERKARLQNPAFGTVFTEHMATVRYAEGKGWYDARVEPFGPLPLSPATAALHYGQEIFEGLKAYRTPDGGAQLFRPADNARRLRQSAHRLAMPAVPENAFLGAVQELVATDLDWLPDAPGTSLYLRPFQIATEEYLGMRPAREYLFGVIACPVAGGIAGTAAAMTVWISDDHTRAAPGGTGAAKCGGNYAASMLPQARAMEAGCHQVVYLDAARRRHVEELGGMNIFFVFDDGSLLTPPLSDSILPGITRDSVIALARAEGLTVEQRPYSIDEWRTDIASGRLLEVFSCGTAAVVAPVGAVRGAIGDLRIGDGGPGPVTERLRAALMDIQYGRSTDPFGWTTRIA
ncbi:branched-chain amino acid aminotransferase [Streptomyces griseofuscus]|uniref:branched-chain amino acid aminotransferase n=1 Tax=Streptomyces TaxID=1883 RepID=UPI0018F0C0A0|nr:branched-chain amino acid aminotransferase [Streptomyces sp. CRPSP2-6A1]MBJ7002385.1 branched-chain amino acid aminotransferase [Streptomyces sp. CRPSP2-6A1]